MAGRNPNRVIRVGARQLTGHGAGVRRYSCHGLSPVQTSHPPPGAMTSEQAAQLIDNTLDLVHQRLQDLESQSLSQEHRALAAEFREWRHPTGGHIDLMVFPGMTNS